MGVWFPLVGRPTVDWGGVVRRVFVRSDLQVRWIPFWTGVGRYSVVGLGPISVSF